MQEMASFCLMAPRSCFCCPQVWNVSVALYLVGTVVWNLFATGEKVFD